MKDAGPGLKRTVPDPLRKVIADDPFAKKIVPTQLTPDGERLVIDEREAVTEADRKELPFSAIGRLVVRFANGVVGTGTGFMAAPGQVITAAHVLHDPLFGQAVSVRFTSACRRGLATQDADFSQEVDHSAVRVAARWIASQYAIEHDFGTVFLPEAEWHQRCGLLPVYPIDLAFMRRHTDRVDSQFIVSGYPADKADADLWMGRGSLAPSLPLQFNHRVDTARGQSGAPVVAIMKDRESGRNVARVVAIHSRALVYLLDYNIARPIEQRLIEEIASWR